MASQTDIINRALSKLGEPRISNALTTDTKPARVMVGMWEQVRDAMLQAYYWRFATIRTNLAADVATPEYGWGFQYSLPPDFLALLDIHENPAYTIEGASDNSLKILTDVDAPLYIRYIRKITNTGQFHPLFNEALATKLAYEGCEEITDSNTKKEALLRDLSLTIAQAYQADAIAVPFDDFTDDEWITARL